MQQSSFDRTNAVVAGLVFLISFVVYALTVQRTISYWDCSEFAACANILAIPHPPGTPLFVIIGRLFAILPFVEDVAYRINYISVISSATTALFSYLVAVRLIRTFFAGTAQEPLNRFIAWCGGFAGGLFVAFSNTNWSNSVEAEVYGMALALSVAIVWLALKFYEQRGTPQAGKSMVLAIYLALLGVGCHMTVFLVVPVCALFFLFNRDAEPRDWAIICGFAIAEILLVLVISTLMPGGHVFFMLLSLVLGAITLLLLYKKLNWAVAIAVISVCSIMIGFALYLWVTLFCVLALILLSVYARQRGWRFEWRSGLAVIAIAFIGFSVHFFIPIRSAHDPRIDQNNPSRGLETLNPFKWQPRTFLDFLDRKQYGNQSMTERMFVRRGALSNQLGRHAHMGFYSYFEEQYSHPGWAFAPFLLLGLLGTALLILRKPQFGLPFFTLLLVTSVGLALYMNFADGTRYNPQTGDAYLEVRDRDYFFTPAFVFFGIAMGVGIAAFMQLVRERLNATAPAMASTAVYACGLLALLPGVTLAKNYYINDRSQNRLAYNYAYNILQSCPPNTLLFTSGDNDTFPLWALQECYDFRKDVRIINLSLLNTDWYVKQMRDTYKVPIPLTDSQIVWHKFESDGREAFDRPNRPFNDRARRRTTYMVPSLDAEGNIVKVADMLMDEIILENQFRDPVLFTAPPYNSPLGLRQRTVAVGMMFKLATQPPPRSIDIDSSFDLFMNIYRYDGFADSRVYREENATGVQLALGVSSSRLYENLLAIGDTTRADRLLDTMLLVYPEYWQLAFMRSYRYDAAGDTAASLTLLGRLRDTLQSFHDRNPSNLFYTQDLGLVKNEIGRRTQNRAEQEKGIALLWEAFRLNPNSSYAFRKLISAIGQTYDQTDPRLGSERRKAAELFVSYKVNQFDQDAMAILGRQVPSGFRPDEL